MTIIVNNPALEVAAANRTYYVRADGSDSNNGLADSSGGAFLTVPKAIDVVAGIYWNGFTPTIQIRSGTYTGAVTLKEAFGAAQTIIVGDTVTPGNVIVSTTSANCFSATSIKTKFSLRGMKLTCATSGVCIQANGQGTYIGFQSIEFGSAITAHMQARFGGYITAEGNYSISGGCARHMFANVLSLVEVTSRTITLSGTPAFSDAFASGEELGEVRVPGCTFSGSATGKRYNSIQNAIVSSNGGGASYFPGDVAGTTATGGIYI